MGHLLRKFRQGFQNKRPKGRMPGNNLLVESLEPRLLLSGYGDDYGDYTWNAASIPDNNNSYNGYIGDYGFDKDMFSFYATGGASYGFAAGYNTLGSIKLSLIDKNGYSIIDTDSNYLYGGGVSLGWTAPSSGNYYLKAESPLYNAGYYGLTLVESLPSDDHGDSASTATNINTNTWINGNIEVSSDRDYFRFYAQEGFKYSVETQTETLTDTYLWLYDTNGTTVIAGNDNYGGNLSSTVEWTAPSSGYRFCTVERSYAGNDSTGTYSLKVAEIAHVPETIVPLDMNTVRLDELTSMSDHDYFSFQSQAGHTYYIRATYIWEEEFTAPFLSLYDQDGITLLEEDISSGLGLSPLIIWTAPENGQYYIEVDPFEPGDYFLSIADGPADWTFMVYIAGDNNLEDAIGPDVEEMINGMLASEDVLSPNINLILQTDGWEEYSYNNSYWQDSTWRYVLSPTLFGSDMNEQNMGDPRTLTDFVNWSQAEFPADHYGLVLWDHGGGFKGVCYEHDANGNPWDYLSMQDLSLAASPFSQDLDFLGFDACLMSMVEVAYQVKDYADIFVASETSEPGDGWKYDEITYAMIEQPTITAQNLAKQIVTAYSHEYEGYYQTHEEITTLAAFDLEKIGSLAAAIDELAIAYLDDAPLDDWYALQNARYGPIQMGKTGYSSDFCELLLLMDRIIYENPSSIITQKANKVRNALLDAQTAEWHDTDLQGVGGMSIYLPAVGKTIDADYNQEIKFLQDTNWDEFIAVFASGIFPNNLPDTVEIPSKGLNFIDADGTQVAVKLTNGSGTATFSGHVTDIVENKGSTLVRGEDLILANIDLSHSNTSTSLTITTKGGVVDGTELGGLAGVSLGKLNAQAIDLNGDIVLSGGLGSMVVDDILAGVNVSTGAGSSNGFSLKAGDIGEAVGFDIAGGVKSFMANSYAGGVLEADGIGLVGIKTGAMGADIFARQGSIQGIDTGGDIKGDISASGSIKKIVSKYGDITGVVRAGTEIGMVGAINLDGAIISAGSNIKKVDLKKDITDTYILGGYDIGTDCAFGLQETGGGDTAGSGDVGSVMAKGKYVRSYTCAGVLPYTFQTAGALASGQSYAGVSGTIGNVKFGSIDYSDSTEDFGLFAATGIKPFKIGREQAESRGQFVMVVM